MSTETLDDIQDNFALFDDWEGRYSYLIDLGKRLPIIDNSLKTDENKVRGCTSQVWMVLRWDGEKLYFQADSDAQIVRGLIYILTLAYQGKTRAEIDTLNINNVMAGLGLDRHLSPSRRNGFFSMVEKIKSAV